MYLTLGDGGNVEGPYRNYVDDVIPGSSGLLTYCAAWQNSITANPYYAPSPSYQTQVHPPGCPVATYQPASGKAGGPGSVPNPIFDPSGDTFFCQTSQPVWSAYRDPSFGFAGFVFEGDDTVTYEWFRNEDQDVGSKEVISQ